jgi:hypothetical protein
VQVLIADDHRLIIEGVKLKLAELDPGIEAVVAMNLDELDRWWRPMRIRSTWRWSTSPCPAPRATNMQPPARRPCTAGDRAVRFGRRGPDALADEIGVLGFIPRPIPGSDAVGDPAGDGWRHLHPAAAAGHAQTRGWQPAERRAASTDSARDRWPAQAADRKRQIDVMRLLSQGKPNKLIARDWASAKHRQDPPGRDLPRLERAQPGRGRGSLAQAGL